ncbi:flagellar basal body P-ring formation chaperone FlgA [Candidatus Trichorickettsia mobilis]|uniref:flagellar basal body P-ring formation chaperone FlgA n=1 Tax=Candidatus Trichorickettsia mobilis TaxID=1346319 RepID=UPI00292CCD08|nr:flagellar basal body P-ring formation chaperone FlgA [Candidatus Trichorickettsia mobilis]
MSRYSLVGAFSNLLSSIALKQVLILLLIFLFSPCFAADDPFDAKIEDLIYEKLGNNQLLIEVQYESKDRVENFRRRQSEIDNISLVRFDPSYATFKAKIQYHNDSTDEVFGRYETFIEMPFASRFIKAGEIIAAGDVTLVKTKALRIREQYLVDENDIIGKQTKKNFTAGMLFKNNELIRPPVIKQNDPVNIIYSSERIKLKTSGTALGTGAIGDMIKVKNEDTGIVLLGQIISKNTVQVGWHDE